MYFLPLPSQERLKEILDYNEETGEFRWKVRPAHRIHIGDIAGSKKLYIMIVVDGITYMAQRLAWMYITGEDPGELQIDHKDNNEHNNKFNNLRKASPPQNKSNQGARKDSKLGLKGVQQIGNRYRVQIQKNGKRHHIGVYDTPEEAHKAYCEAADKLHGEYANYG